MMREASITTCIEVRQHLFAIETSASQPLTLGGEETLNSRVAGPRQADVGGKRGESAPGVGMREVRRGKDPERVAEDGMERIATWHPE
jgi:hypothetical protein